MSVRLPVTGGHVRASSGCSTATFHTVSGTNLSWPSDNGAGKDMRARFGKYVAQSNEDNRRTNIIVQMDQQDWKQKVTIERHVAQTYF